MDRLPHSGGRVKSTKCGMLLKQLPSLQIGSRLATPLEGEAQRPNRKPRQLGQSPAVHTQTAQEPDQPNLAGRPFAEVSHGEIQLRRAHRMSTEYARSCRRSRDYARPVHTESSPGCMVVEQRVRSVENHQCACLLHPHADVPVGPTAPVVGEVKSSDLLDRSRANQ